MEKKIEMFCQLNKDLYVGLDKIRENEGHDDSIPYQAEIHIGQRDPETKEVRFRKIGVVFNTGWGGDSEIRVDHQNNQLENNRLLLKQIDEECAKHKAYYKGTPFIKYDAGYLFDIMAEKYLYELTHVRDKQIGYWFDDDPHVLDKVKNPNHRNCYTLKKQL